MSIKKKILVVDDEPFNLDILTEYLSEAGYEVISAEDGLVALKRLQEHPDVDLVVLDRMMPHMDGIEVLKTIKSDDKLKHIPVIMQTAAAQSKQILEGIEAGVYYYLTKPYEDTLLLNIVRAALLDALNQNELREEVHSTKRIFGMMSQARFRVRTLDEARTIAFFIATAFPDPDAAIYGLTELLINAIEHGNLGITYDEKTALIIEDSWQEEVTRRLSLEENKNKYVSVLFELADEKIKLSIKDEGAGFDFKPFLEMTPERCLALHGRGIAMSKMLSFDTQEYIGCGNEVVCTVSLTKGR